MKQTDAVIRMIASMYRLHMEAIDTAEIVRGSH